MYLIMVIFAIIHVVRMIWHKLSTQIIRIGACGLCMFGDHLL